MVTPLSGVQVGRPWHEAESSERITIGVIAVLAGSGYKLSMPINIDQDTRVYFFIKDPEEQSDCYKVTILIFDSLHNKTQNVHLKASSSSIDLIIILIL